jgi:hypothetical protein
MSLPSGDGVCGQFQIFLHGCIFCVGRGNPSGLTVLKNDATGSGNGARIGEALGLGDRESLFVFGAGDAARVYMM